MVWLWYGYGMVIVWYSYGTVMVRLWYGYGSNNGPLLVMNYGYQRNWTWEIKRRTPFLARQYTRNLGWDCHSMWSQPAKKKRTVKILASAFTSKTKRRKTIEWTYISHSIRKMSLILKRGACVRRNLGKNISSRMCRESAQPWVKS
jgi:hypothetical protein